MEVKEAKTIVEAIAASKGVLSQDFVADAVASGHKKTLMLIEANSELRADVAGGLKQ
jgi:hypothetical protein